MKKQDYPSQVDAKDEYSANETAIILNVSKPTVVKLVDGGKIPGAYRSEKGKKDRRIPHDALIRYITSQPDSSISSARFRYPETPAAAPETAITPTQEATPDHVNDDHAADPS